MFKRFKEVSSQIEYEVSKSGLHEIVKILVLDLCHFIFNPLDFSVVTSLECISPNFKMSK